MNEKDYMQQIENELRFMQQQPQSQRSLRDQLIVLVALANRMGLYDAADFVRDKMAVAIQEES